MAKGSHQTLAPWAPRNCAICGKRVLRKAGLWNYHVQTNTSTALHHECAPAWFRARRREMALFQ